MPMPLRLLALASVLWLAACSTAPPRADAGGAPSCANTAHEAGTDPRVERAIAEARRQHEWFGGQTIERDGGMYRAGGHEASLASAQRIAQFWRAVSETAPDTLVTSVGRVPRSEALPPTPAAAGGEPDRAALAVHEALLRAAVVDTPWSAAFISHLMKVAGFSRAEFAFSDRHADYVQAAFDASAAQAEGRAVSHRWRACDVASTPPRAGDLLCATRAGTAGLTRFDALRDAMATRSPRDAFPMHCDLVVHADAEAGVLDVIGGNVLHSVTRSRLGLSPQGVLDAQYIGRGEPAAGCASADPACRGHLSRRPWVVLLQFGR